MYNDDDCHYGTDYDSVNPVILKNHKLVKTLLDSRLWKIKSTELFINFEKNPNYPNFSYTDAQMTHEMAHLICATEQQIKLPSWGMPYFLGLQKVPLLDLINEYRVLCYQTILDSESLYPIYKIQSIISSYYSKQEISNLCVTDKLLYIHSEFLNITLEQTIEKFLEKQKLALNILNIE